MKDRKAAIIECSLESGWVLLQKAIAAKVGELVGYWEFSIQDQAGDQFAVVAQQMQSMVADIASKAAMPGPEVTLQGL